MFDRVVSADWSVNPAKRWMAVAEREGERWTVRDVTRVPDPPLLLIPREGRTLLGFDFPIGVPDAYATRAGVERFVDLLLEAGRGRFAAFYEPATTPEEISITRPFYPRRPGGTSRAQLSGALGLDDPEQLYRQCERRTARRDAASPLFWTLGAKQVGRAAIAGWRDVLVPALRSEDYDVALWPFHGELAMLSRTHRVVACETYPAEAYRHLGFPRRGWSKRNEADRRRLIGRALLDGPAGEDPFDALVALRHMLDVVAGRLPAHPFAEWPPGLAAREGWILGQQDLPL